MFHTGGNAGPDSCPELLRVCERIGTNPSKEPGRLCAQLCRKDQGIPPAALQHGGMRHAPRLSLRCSVLSPFSQYTSITPPPKDETKRTRPHQPRPFSVFFPVFVRLQVSFHIVLVSTDTMLGSACFTLNVVDIFHTLLQSSWWLFLRAAYHPIWWMYHNLFCPSPTFGRVACF